LPPNARNLSSHCDLPSLECDGVEHRMLRDLAGDQGTATWNDGGPNDVSETDSGGQSLGPGSGPGGAGSAPAVRMASVGRHAVVYAIGNVLSKAVSFVMLPVYTRYLTPADYGVMALIEMTLDIISILAGAQIALGIFRYYYKAKTEPEQNAVVSTALIALGVSYGVVGAVAFAVAGPLTHLIFREHVDSSIMRVAALSFAVQSLYLVPLAYARIRDNSTIVVTTNVAKLFISVALNIVFVVVLRMGVVGVFLSNLCASVIIGVGMTGWLVRQVGFGWSGAAVRDLVRYGSPLLGMKIATFLATFADRYFLQATGNETMVGLYNLAYQFGFLMLFVGFSPFNQIWEPKRFLIAQGPNPSPALSTGFRLMNLVLLAVGVGIILFVGDALHVMATPPFFSAANLVPIIVAAYVLQGWAAVQDIGILVKERTGVLMAVNWASAIVALAGYALLVPRYFGLGAAIATVVSFAVRWVLTYVISQRLWHVRYQWGPVLSLTMVSAAVCLISLSLPAQPLLGSIAIHVALYCVYLVLIWRGRILTPAERTAAVALARQGLILLGGRVRSLGWMTSRQT
jgi:O-antigen/teichoic acid export membrane protein